MTASADLAEQLDKVCEGLAITGVLDTDRGVALALSTCVRTSGTRLVGA